MQPTAAIGAKRGTVPAVRPDRTAWVVVLCLKVEVAPLPSASTQSCSETTNYVHRLTREYQAVVLEPMASALLR